MSIPAQVLTEEEEKLLRAAVSQARAGGPPFEIRRIPYGFEINLPEYGEAIIDAAHKARWEAGLKRLLTDGFLQRIEAGHQSWHYTVTGKGFAAVPEAEPST